LRSFQGPGKIERVRLGSTASNKINIRTEVEIKRSYAVVVFLVSGLMWRRPRFILEEKAGYGQVIQSNIVIRWEAAYLLGFFSGSDDDRYK
jgi:hypothetical protein